MGKFLKKIQVVGTSIVTLLTIVDVGLVGAAAALQDTYPTAAVWAVAVAGIAASTVAVIRSVAPVIKELRGLLPQEATAETAMTQAKKITTPPGAGFS